MVGSPDARMERHSLGACVLHVAQECVIEASWDREPAT